MTKSSEILEKYWGFSEFRPLQEEIAGSAIYGHDTLAILPTGGGKSICFQVPGIALDGVTIVISPLIALMQDQVNNLEKRGIQASMISSSMSYREIDIVLDNARFGNTQFLYVSPERLKSDLFLERFKRMKVGLIVIDEAHCISEWGHDFRPSYREITEIRQLHPETPFIALTASATPKVQEEIIKLLHLKNPNVFVGSLKRDNIRFRVLKTENKIEAITEYCKSDLPSTGIIYGQTRRDVKQIALHLRANGISAGVYHGGLSSEDRKYMLEEWMAGKIKVMVSTNAFGMGIDKPDVRYVLHYQVPTNIEAYYQEAGRAGRDSKPAQAIGFWTEQDLSNMQQMLRTKYPEKDRVKQVYNSVANFLNIAIGSGEFETYPFDIQSFSKNFGISISECYYALKLLQLNQNLTFTEANFHPTRLKFAVGNAAIYNYQVGHERSTPLITLLSRSYPGIFDRFVTIHEKELCKRLKISDKELTEQLQRMEQFGVIDINYQTKLPLLTFLHERLPDTHISIRSDVYDGRKKVEEDKLKSIEEYLQSNQCRSSFISKYFGEEVEDCGNCDNCLQNVNMPQSEIIENIIIQLPATINELKSNINCAPEALEGTIRHLMMEEKIVYKERKYELVNS